ncbi:MAG TPA: hypothetical protein VKU94_00580 [Geobacterales bacterium]|nr:hypothetical protein [Geobacterales bacterium]
MSMNVSKEDLKKILLDMLLTDSEFRYAVGGAIGYKEILDRIVKLEKRTAKLEQMIAENQARNEERFLKLEQMIAENQARNEARFLKVEEEIKSLREDYKLLRKDMQEGFKRQDRRLRYIESFIENLSLSVEEEAREVVEYWLKQKGISVKIKGLVLPEVEIDLYATDNNICFIGEAKTKAARKAIMKVENDIKRLQRKYPSYLREKIVKIVYAIQAMPDAVEEARKRGIWLVTAKGELTELKIS